MPFDGVDSDDVVHTLLGAKDIVLRRGLLKGGLGFAGEARCVIGAIREASGWEEEASGAVACLANWLAAECYGLAVGASRVEKWQDDPERLLQEVLAGFDLAVDRRLQAVLTRAEI